jgi:uncharacterized protein (DUF2336 family)
MSAATYNVAQAQSLVDLARHHSPEDRARLFTRVADLFQAPAQAPNGNEHALLVEIMRALSTQVDIGLRLSLAERLAGYANADHDLIRLLAHDRIEVAAPIILKSVVLTEYDLVEIIQECSVDHCTTVARRPDIAEPVSDALVQTEVPDVLRALAANDTAKITLLALQRLADAARDDKTLMSKLVARSELPKGIALRMYSWASVALRKHILENFDIDPKLLDQELTHAVSRELTRDSGETHTKRLQDLVNKLYHSGQLKAGFLLKALREDQLDLFRLAFARLTDVDPSIMTSVLGSRDLRVIALAVRSVGIDRSAFQTIIEKLLGNGALETLDPALKQSVAEALAIPSPDAARVRLEAALRTAA